MQTEQMIPKDETQIMEPKPEPEKKKKPKKYNNTPEYNAAYYKKNRERTLERLLTKHKCDLCDRMVNYQNIPAHKLTKLCQKSRKQ